MPKRVPVCPEGIDQLLKAGISLCAFATMADSPVAATPLAATEAAAPGACAPSPAHVIDLVSGSAMPTAPPPPKTKKAKNSVDIMQRWMSKANGELVQRIMAALRLNLAMPLSCLLILLPSFPI